MGKIFNIAGPCNPERHYMLPTTVARLTGGTFDLGGNDQTLKALCGTAGEVKNGSVTVTEGIYPGGAGTIGSFSVGAALAGTLFVDVDATGAADSILTTTALDLSNLDLVIMAPATAPEVLRRLNDIPAFYFKDSNSTYFRLKGFKNETKAMRGRGVAGYDAARVLAHLGVRYRNWPSEKIDAELPDGIKSAYDGLELVLG